MNVTPYPRKRLRRPPIEPKANQPRRSAHQKWETIRYAIDNTGRTIRLCCIFVVLAAAPAVVPVVIILLHGHSG